MSNSALSPGSQSSLREANTARVLEAVARFGKLTQVELSSATGLSQATISNIVKRLVSAGAVETENTIRSGRRAQLVKMARQSGLLAGVQIGRRDLKIALSDRSQNLLSTHRMPLPDGHRPDTTLDRAVLMLFEMVEGLGADAEELSAVGVTLPAPVHPVTSFVSAQGLMPEWEGIDVRATLESRLGRPVVVDNDANAAVWAEARFGALRGIDHGVFVRASHSIGAGVLANGQVQRGPTGTMGEIGHVQVDPEGMICVCGARGCLNVVVGSSQLLESLRFSRGVTSLNDVIRGARDGDPGCRQVVSDVGKRLGQVVADVATLFEPARIVVGGELVEAGDYIQRGIEDGLISRPLVAGRVEVVESELGGEAEVRGALALAADVASELAAATSQEGVVVQ